jgi:hypothetical protein
VVAATKQVSPSASSKENRYLIGFMRSPFKPQLDEQAQQALNKEPLSLISRTKQAEDGLLDAKQGQRAGDVKGHGGSVSAPHGSPSLDPPVSAHLAGMPPTAASIRTGSLLSSSQQTDGIRINSNISAQVNIGEEFVPQPQRVLGEAFCITRLDKIRQLAGDLKLRDFTDGSDRDHCEGEITHLFRRFSRENVGGDPPFFCVSASILGRLVHTFKEEYISNDKQRKTSLELDLHVDEVMEKAKESMAQDATAIRMQTQNCIDRQSRLIADAHARCEATLAVAHSRMRVASKVCEDAFAEALN